MIRNTIETLFRYGRPFFGANKSPDKCMGQMDYPEILIDIDRRDRNDDIYRATLAAMQKAQPGEVTVVRSHYSYENNLTKLIGYTTHYFRFPRKD